MQNDPTPPAFDGSLRFQCHTSNFNGEATIALVHLSFNDFESWGECNAGFYIQYKDRRDIYPWTSIVGPLMVRYNSDEQRREANQYWHDYHQEHADFAFDDRCRVCSDQKMREEFSRQGIMVLPQEEGN